MAIRLGLKIGQSNWDCKCDDAIGIENLTIQLGLEILYYDRDCKYDKCKWDFKYGDTFEIANMTIQLGFQIFQVVVQRRDPVRQQMSCTIEACMSPGYRTVEACMWTEVPRCDCSVKPRPEHG